MFVQAWPNLSLFFFRAHRDEQRSLINSVTTERDSMVGMSRITNLYPPSMRHPEPSLPCFIRTMLCMRRRRICSATLQGRRSSEQSWITLLCSGADPSASHPNTQKNLRVGGPGFTGTVSKHFAFRVACLRMARRGGMDDRHTFLFLHILNGISPTIPGTSLHPQHEQAVWWRAPGDRAECIRPQSTPWDKQGAVCSARDRSF